MREKLVHAVDEIRSVMTSINEIFKSDSEEVQREWIRFTQKVDKKMEEALRHTIKKSLQVGARGASTDVQHSGLGMCSQMSCSDR